MGCPVQTLRRERVWGALLGKATLPLSGLLNLIQAEVRDRSRRRRRCRQQRNRELMRQRHALVVYAGNGGNKRSIGVGRIRRSGKAIVSPYRTQDNQGIA